MCGFAAVDERERDAVLRRLAQRVHAAFDRADHAQHVGAGGEQAAFARHQHGMLKARAQHIPEKGELGGVLAAPRIRAAAEGIGTALCERFIAVIHACHARHGRDKAQHQPGAAHAQRQLLGRERERRARAARELLAAAAAQDVDDAGAVVAAQQIHERVKERLGVVFKQAGKLAVYVHGAFLAQQKVDQRVAQGIIHHRIERIAEHVGTHFAVGNLVGRVLPHFAQHGCLRIDGFDLAAQRTQKRHRQLVRHVQPPAARALAEIMLDDRILAGENEGGIIRVILPDVGQRIKAPPAVIGGGILLEGEPAVIGRILRLARAYDGVMAVTVEVNAVIAHVGEHAVKHDADAHCARGGAQVLKIRLRAEHRIDHAVIAGVVFVIGGRAEDGVEVNRRHAQILEIGELLFHTLEIAAEKIARVVIAVARLLR